MFKDLKTRMNHADRTGAMLPMVGVVMVFLFVACILGVDIARMHLSRSELRTATDAAARAAVESLGRVQDINVAADAAIEVAQRNLVANDGFTLRREDIRFGAAVQDANGTFSFQEGTSFINSVRVVGERSANTPDGPVSMFFGSIFGTDSFSPRMTSTATRLDRDIALVLDKSGSMSQNGRFPALLNGVNVFLNLMNQSLSEERISLTAYDEFPVKLVNMTNDTNAILNGISSQTPSGFTGIGRALEVGINSIQNDPGSRGAFSLKTIILMTDGNQNRGINPLQVAPRAAAAGITVHTITFSSGANESLMRQVADATGGTHLHAESNQELIDAFETIARTVQVLTIE